MKDFLNSAEGQLKYNKDKSAVLVELGDHFQTKKEFFESIGYDEESSAEKANEAMGDGVVIGQRLNSIHSKKNEILIYIIAFIVKNLLFFVFKPTNKNTYFSPFLFAVFIILYYFANTETAVRLKSRVFSILIIVYSCTIMFFSTQKLVYPICNLIISRSTSFYATDIYDFVKIVLTLLINATVILPNAFNIYHCSQIRLLKNTKRQNKIASAILVFCLIMPCLIVAPAYPSYKLNDRLCKEQAEIRDELIAFAYDIDSKFESNKDDKLVEYLKNSEYDFDLCNNVNYYYSYEEPEATVKYNYSYICYKGNWRLEVTFFEDNDDYILLFENRKMNSSHKYLFTPYDIEDALLDEFGRDEFNGLNGGVVGKSAEEIKNRMNEVNIQSLTIYKYRDRTIYSYNWAMAPVLYGLFGYDYYTFFVGNDGICYEYDLILD